MRTIKSLVFALVLLLAAGAAAGALAASGAGAGKTTAATEAEIPEPLTRAAVRDLLAELDDAKVRELLLKRLSEDADKRARELAAGTETSFRDWSRHQVQAFTGLIAAAVSKIPAIPGGIAKAWATFSATRGDRALSWLLAGLGLSLAAGLVAAWLSRAPAAALERHAASGHRTRPVADLASLALGVAAHFLPVAAFAGVATLTNLTVNAQHAPDADLTGRFIEALAWTGFVVTTARVALTPTLTSWQQCPVASGATDFLVWRLGLVALVFNMGFGLTRWMNLNGIAVGETWLGFWIALVFHGILIATIWQERRGISAIVAGSDRLAHENGLRLAQWWPALMIAALIVHWIVVVALVATATVGSNIVTAMAITVAVLTGMPVINHAIRALIDRLYAIRDGQSPALAAADRTTQEGLVRIARVALGSVLIVAMLKLWDVNVMSMAARSMGDRLAEPAMHIALIVGLAYAVWELVHIVIDRQIATERVALGLDNRSDEATGEGEGGGAGARLGTLLPLVSVAAQIAIVVLTVLAILGELGVNILPLLAGAGVIGLAVGFGAQTLVRDIISGIFFLIDDAFRKGEYIDIGPVKGTVEKISLRSMQLRHHNGPLHTIPFGDIRHVTNFSRDWVIMKLSLRLTYDTDAERVRMLIKKLGQEMAEEENLKPLFLAPLKSQGVIQMEDSAMIMRVKFMTRPGDQWGLRRVVFARLRELFEKEGIRFASREVVVRIADHLGERTLTEAEQEAAAAAAARVTETLAAPRTEPARA